MTIPAHLHITAHILQVMFMVGVAGCVISIPIIAVKFASVLFERDHEETEEPASAQEKADE